MQPAEQHQPDEHRKKAKRYSRIRLGVLLGRSVYNLSKASAFAFSGYSAGWRAWLAAHVSDQRLVDPTYLISVDTATWICDLPISYLTGLSVERSFDLTRESTGRWLGDQVKGLVLGWLLEVPLTLGAFAVIRRRPRDWWLILSGAAIPLAVLGSQLAPVLIMPIFNKYTPIANRELADRIRELAAQVDVEVADIFQMDMSRQTEKANAFFTGLGRTKRIVLGDTLLARFSPEEIEGIVAHELGHQVHGDIWRLIGFGAGFGFAGAYAAQRLLTLLIARTAGWTHVTSVGDIAVLPQMALVTGALGLAALPIQSAFSRMLERRADQFAVELTGQGETYASAITRLAKQNLSDPDPSPLVVFFLYSHPPEAERVAAARALATIQRAEWATDAG